MIIGLYENSNPNNPNSYVSKLITRLQLVDVIIVYNCSQENTPTYFRGTQRIDVVLESKLISEQITYASIIPRAEIIDSDHHGIIIDMNAPNIWNKKQKDITKIQRRHLNLSRPKNITTYLNTILKLLKKTQD